MENNPEPTTEEIAAVAKSYGEEEGQPEGKAEEHWARAEQSLRNRSQTQSGTAPAEPQ